MLWRTCHRRPHCRHLRLGLAALARPLQSRTSGWRATCRRTHLNRLDSWNTRSMAGVTFPSGQSSTGCRRNWVCQTVGLQRSLCWLRPWRERGCPLYENTDGGAYQVLTSQTCHIVKENYMYFSSVPVFWLHGKFMEKKFPRTPYETCKRGSRWTTLLEYENRSPKNCLLPMLSPSPKRDRKMVSFFKIVFWAPKIHFLILFCFVFRIDWTRTSKKIDFLTQF
jgi:hypothetical protein